MSSLFETQRADSSLLRSGGHEQRFFRGSTQTPPTAETTSVTVYPVAIAAMALGTDPSAICLQWPAPEPRTARLCAECDLHAGLGPLNQESKERWHNLANRAKALGWMPERVGILDGDLGHSGEQATHRDDFKALVSDVAMGQVDAIFSLEASHLARSKKDRHRLLNRARSPKRWCSTGWL
jgi:hypothetical protein